MAEAIRKEKSKPTTAPVQYSTEMLVTALPDVPQDELLVHKTEESDNLPTEYMPLEEHEEVQLHDLPTERTHDEANVEIAEPADIALADYFHYPTIANLQSRAETTEQIYPDPEGSLEETTAIYEPPVPVEFPTLQKLIYEEQKPILQLPRSNTGQVLFQTIPEEHHPLYLLLEQYLVAEKDYQRAHAQLHESLQSHQTLTNNCWTTKVQDVLINGGFCKCGKQLVEKSINILQADFISQHANQLQEEMENSIDLYASKILPSLYKRKKGKAEVEIFLDSYIASCSFISNLSTHGFVVVVPEENYSDSVRREIVNLLEYIKILFYFTRAASDDDYVEGKLFFENVYAWILKLGAMILRCGTSMDHCMLVYMLLQSPRMEEWDGAALLQFPTYWDDSSSSASHFLSMLSVVMDHSENPMHKNIESVLEQFPFIEFFEFVFQTEGHHHLVLLQICRGMVQIIRPALKRYQSSHQICVLLTKVVLQAVKEISYFLHEKSGQLHSSYRAQFEDIVIQCIATIASHSVKGMNQYLATLPFAIMEDLTCWKIFFVLYNIPMQLQEKLLTQQLPTCEAWDSAMAHFLQIRNEIMKILSEDRLLLHTFGALAVSCGTELAAVICSEIFYATVISPVARNECYKIGREVLADICNRFPSCLPKLLRLIDANLSEMNKAALVVAEDLPWHLLEIDDDGFKVLERWFTASLPGQSITYYLAAIITERLAWGYSFTSYESWINNAQDSKLPIGIRQQIVLLLCHIYIHSRDHRSGLFQSLLGDKDHHPSLKNYCWRVFFKATFTDSVGNASTPTLSSSAAEIQEIRNFVHANTGKKTVIPLYILLQCTDYGRDYETFIKQAIPLLEPFLANKVFHPAFARLLHDLLPHLISHPMRVDVAEETIVAVEPNADNFLPRVMIQRLLKSEALGAHAVGLLAAKLIVQSSLESVANEMLHFWINSLPPGNHLKTLANKHYLNLVFMAGSHVDQITCIQCDLMDLVKGKKQGIFEFFVSCTYNDKLRFPWVGYHFLLLESRKQRKAWKQVLTELAEANGKGDKAISKALQKEKKTFNLQQLSIHQIAGFCCDWDFAMALAAATSPEGFCDPWTPIILFWQLFFHISSQIVAQSFIPASGMYGNVFLTAMKSEYNALAQQSSLTRNITAMEKWLANPFNEEEQKVANLRDNIERLRDLFQLILSWYSSENADVSSFFQRSIESQTFLDLENGTPSLFLHQVVHRSTLYRDLISRTNEFVTLPNYQMKTTTITEAKKRRGRSQSQLERQTLPPPEFINSLPKASALPVQNNYIPIRVDILLHQQKLFETVMNRWKHLDALHLQLLPTLYTTRPPLVETFHCRKNSCRPSQLQIQINAHEIVPSILEKLQTGREQIQLLAQEQLITEDFIHAALETLYTLANLNAFIEHEESAIHVSYTPSYASAGSSDNLILLKRNAERLFFQFLEILDEKSASFVPLCDLVLECIHRLEFVLKESASLLTIYETMFKNPTRARLCREKFFPMVNLDFFVPLYELVVNRIPENDSETNDYLRSCLDESQWLATLSLSSYSHPSDPAYQECIRIFKIILSTPDKQESTFSIVATYLFPLFFCDALGELIIGIDDRRVLPETMNQFVWHVEQNINAIPPEMAVKASTIIKENLWKSRREESLFHCHWAVFSSLFLRLNRCLVKVCMDSGCYDLRTLFQYSESLYGPWISHNTTNMGWSESNNVLALPLLRDFVESLSNLVTLFPHQKNTLMKLFWDFFTTSLSNTKEICHWQAYNDLIGPSMLPWDFFQEWELVSYQLTHQVWQFNFQMNATVLTFWKQLVMQWVNGYRLTSDEWKKFYLPLLSFFHCFPLPVSVEDTAIFRKFLLSIPWNEGTFDDLEALLKSHEMQKIFETHYLGTQMIQNAETSYQLDIVIDKPIHSIDERFCFMLNYLRQSCLSRNFVALDRSLEERFPVYFHSFEVFLGFIVQWMERVQEFKSSGCGNVLSMVVFAMIESFAIDMGRALQVLGESRVIQCLRQLVKIVSFPQWTKVGRELMISLAEKRHDAATYLFGLCSVDLAQSPLLPEYGEIILQKFFHHDASSWNYIVPHFCIVKDLPHKEFQVACSKQGHGLMMYCYFRRLHQINQDESNKLGCMIVDLWKMIQTYFSNGNYEKLLLLYFLLVKLIRAHIVVRQNIDREISTVLAQILPRMKELSEDKFGGVLGVGGTPSHIPIVPRFGFRILYVFLAVQVSNGAFIRSPNKNSREALNQLLNLQRKREYHLVAPVFPQIIEFLKKCMCKQLSDIYSFHDLVYQLLFSTTTSLHYWRDSAQ